MKTINNAPQHENHLDADEPRWFAVRTKFRSEKVALKQLEFNNVNAYLPIRNVIRKYGKKRRSTDLPLISSFVFVKITKSEYINVLKTEYVAGFLKFGNNLLSIPEHEIEMIRRLLGTDIEIEIENTELQKGDWVEVAIGPLLGLRGQLIQQEGKERFLVALTNSGYSLDIKIDKSILRKIEPL